MTADQLTIDIAAGDGCVDIRVRGDMATASQLRDALLAATGQQATTLLVDMGR
jgi:hypothetical protein